MREQSSSFAEIDQFKVVERERSRLTKYLLKYIPRMVEGIWVRLSNTVNGGVRTGTQYTYLHWTRQHLTYTRRVEHQRQVAGPQVTFRLAFVPITHKYLSMVCPS